MKLRTEQTERDRPSEATSKAAISLEGLHILVVEDSLLNREVLMEFLEEKGAVVVGVENGQEAVDTFAKSPIGAFDLILTDVRMPVMNGLEEARCIRAMDRADAGTIPMVACSANVFVEDVEKSLAAGMNAHIGKLVRIKVLESILPGIMPQKE